MAPPLVAVGVPGGGMLGVLLGFAGARSRGGVSHMLWVTTSFSSVVVVVEMVEEMDVLSWGIFVGEGGLLDFDFDFNFFFEFLLKVLVAFLCWALSSAAVR